MIALEDEAYVLLIQLRAVFLVHLVDRLVHEIVFPGPRAVMHAEKMQQRGFTGPRGSHGGDTLAVFDVDVDAPQDVGLGGPMLEELLYIAKRNHGIGHVSFAAARVYS